jgi:hypothetical protein
MGHGLFSRVSRPGAFVFCLALFLCACHNIQPVDTAPLDAAGMIYDSIQQVKALRITAPEVGSLAAARRAGLSDANCVQLMQIYRARSKPFDAGDTVAGLLQAGIGQATVVELAKLNQLGLGAGDLEALHLAEFPDDMILEVARHHSENKPVLSGASLAQLKNSGLRESTLLEIVRRSVPDSDAPAILTMRKHGGSDVQILQRFAGS